MVVAGVVVGFMVVAALETVMVPCIKVWKEQWYGIVAALEKV